MRILILLLAFTVSIFPGKGGLCATFEADIVPWSGYWWPFTSGALVTGDGYHGHPAPLEKYDLVTVGTKDGPATEYGRQFYYNPQALSWEGLCFNWAAAAILEPEPTHKGIFQNTAFLVGDKKALLTVAYDGALYNKYPINNPADFHDLLEEFITNQKMPIMMDLGTDGEVWFYPVFKYETHYTRENSIRHYTTTIYYATDAVPPDYKGTAVSSSTYYYYFKVDAEGNITDIGWEGDSIGHAPVRACEPFGGTQPRNPGIDFNMVKQIVSTDDDPYEENDSFESRAALSTYAYNLVAMDDDFFYIPLKQGDRFKVQIISETEDILLKIYDPEGALLGETAVGAKQIIEAQQSGEYTIKVIPLEPEEEHTYTLYLEHNLPFQAIFPIHPAGSWGTGVALFDSHGKEGRKIISLFDDSGYPQKSYSPKPGISFLLGTIEEDFGLTHENKGYIKIDSDTPLLGLEASFVLGYLMLGANLMPLDESSEEIFYPHLYNKEGWKTFFGLLNTGDYTEEVLRISYGADGQILKTQTVVLAPGERFEEDTSYQPILSNGSRCMTAETLSNRASLLGYIKILNPSIGAKGRALVPLTGNTGPELVIPHMAIDDNWWTGVVVMNAGYDDSGVVFLAYDDNGNLLASSEHLLRPGENLLQFASDLFSDTPAKHIASIRISSVAGQPLYGLVLYGSKDNNRLAGMPLSAPREFPVYLPHIASSNGWWAGIGLVNSSAETAAINFLLLDEDGNIVAEEDRALNENAHMAVTIKDLFKNFNLEDARCLKIDAIGNQVVSGIYLMGSDDGLNLMGDIIR